VECVSDTMLYITLRVRWCDIIFQNSPTEGKTAATKDWSAYSINPRSITRNFRREIFLMRKYIEKTPLNRQVGTRVYIKLVMIIESEQ
jgi:hypothetical protein